MSFLINMFLITFHQLYVCVWCMARCSNWNMDCIILILYVLSGGFEFSLSGVGGKSLSWDLYIPR